MFHEKVALCAQGKGSDCGLKAKEALVVAVIGYAVCSSRVVVDKAEIVS